MANDFLSQILGSVLGGGGASGAQGSQGGLGGLGGLGDSLGGLGGLGGVLGSVLGGGARSNEDGETASPSGNKGALLAMLLPLAMQLIQRNGGVGGLLDRFKQGGYGQQAASWVSTGENAPLDAQAVGEVVGADELASMSQQLGVPADEVAGGLAEILPQVVNHLSPSGDVPADADDTLSQGLSALTRAFGQR